jgi:twitching motility protein PilT
VLAFAPRIVVLRIQDLVRLLIDAGSADLVLESDERPALEQDGVRRPASPEALEHDHLIALLMQLGGSRHLEDLGEAPRRWATRVPGGLGSVTVSAHQRGERIEARITRAAAAGDAPPTRRPSQQPPKAKLPEPSRRGSQAGLAASRQRATLDELRAQPAKRPSRSDLPKADGRAAPSARLDPSRSETKPDALRAQRKTPQRGVRATKPEGRAAPSDVDAALDALGGEPPSTSRSQAFREAPTAPPRAPSEADSPEAQQAERTAPQRKMSLSNLSWPPVEAQRAGGPLRPSIELPRVDPVALLREGGAASPGALLALEGRRDELPAYAALEAPSVTKSEALALLAEPLEAAREHGASELVLAPGLPFRARVAGALAELDATLDAALLVSVLMALVPEHARQPLARKGLCRFVFVHPSAGPVRATVLLARGVPEAVLRPLPLAPPTLASIGLQELAAHLPREGLVLITSPPGHGATTTLGALLHKLAEGALHLVLVDDPVELPLPASRGLVRAVDVSEHLGNLSVALDDMASSDVDVVALGMPLDGAALRAALSLAASGVLVLVAATAESPARAIERWLLSEAREERAHVRDMLSSVLRLTLGQRLLPSVDGRSLVAAFEVRMATPTTPAIVSWARERELDRREPRGSSFDDALATLVRTGAVARDTAACVARDPQGFDARLTETTEAEITP